MRRAFVLALIAFLAPAAAPAAVSIGLRASYFSLSDPDFRSLYGGGVLAAGEVTFGLVKRLDLWLDGGFFAKTGALSYTLEETRLTLIPIGLGLRYRILPGKIFPYVAAGFRHFFFREKNALGEVTAEGTGIIGKLGLAVALSDRFGFDVQAGYSSCKMRPADFEFNVGGLEFGAGLVVSF